MGAIIAIVAVAVGAAILLTLAVCKAASDADDQADRQREAWLAEQLGNVGAEAPSNEADAGEGSTASAPTIPPGAESPPPEAPVPGPSGEGHEGSDAEAVSEQEVTPAAGAWSEGIRMGASPAGEPTTLDTATVLRELAAGADPDNHLHLRTHLLTAAAACDSIHAAGVTIGKLSARVVVLEEAGWIYLRVSLDSGASWGELGEAAQRFRAILDSGDPGEASASHARFRCPWPDCGWEGDQPSTDPYGQTWCPRCGTGVEGTP